MGRKIKGATHAYIKKYWYLREKKIEANISKGRGWHEFHSPPSMSEKKKRLRHFTRTWCTVCEKK